MKTSSNNTATFSHSFETLTFATPVVERDLRAEANEYLDTHTLLGNVEDKDLYNEILAIQEEEWDKHIAKVNAKKTAAYNSNLTAELNNF